MKRFIILGAIGVAAILLAAALDLFINRDEPDEPAPVASVPALPAPTPAGTPAGTSSAATTSAAPTNAAPPSAEAEARADARPQDPVRDPPRPEHAGAVGPAGAGGDVRTTAERAAEAPTADKPPIQAPTFDIVRVNREGAAVIAGHAAPDSTVTVRDGDGKVGTVQADRRGDWVLIPDRPLEPGTRQLTIESADRAGRTAESEQVVVLAIPDPATTDRKALAVAVPRDEVAPSRVLQGAGVPADPHATIPEATSPEGAQSGADSGPQSGAVASAVPEGGSHGTGESASSDVGGPLGKTPRVETVDYDETGKVALSGAAAPGSEVGVFLDGMAIGTASADRTGRWQLTPETDVAPGRYTLRAEERDASGRLSGRVEMPFERAGEMPDLPPGEVAVVQPGNSLWRIARRTYGDGVRYTVIYDANKAQIRNPHLIYPGQIFTIPKAEPRATN